MKDRYLRIFLFVLGLLVASVLAAAMPAGASTPQTDAELLQSAAQEFSAMIKPYVVTLPDDTLFYNWNSAISKQEQVGDYIQKVASGYGTGRQTDDWEGPGLYLAQDPESSLSFGQQLIILKIRKGSELLYINAKGATPFQFDKNSKIREWLTRKGQAAGKVPNFDDLINPHWLSDAPGGGDLVRAAGIVGFLYQWNQAKAPSDCAQMTNQALDLIAPSAVIYLKIVTGDFIFQTPLAQLKALKSDQDVIYTHILPVEIDADEQDDGGAWKSALTSQELSDYTAWKHAHLFYCQKPYLAERFPDTV
jgi:hypothetical protein